MITPVRAADRVRDVLARDPRLLDVFVAQSPSFERLRNPGMRRIMTAVVSVEQAAAFARVPLASLLTALNSALGIASSADDTAVDGSEPPEAAPPRHPAGCPEIEVDVREELRGGGEPFPRIMGAVRRIGGGEVLRIRATFEPAPLVAVLGPRGFRCETEQHGAEDWSLWAWRDTSHDAAPSTRAAGRHRRSVDADPGAAERWLDVRGLEPPEPMARTLAALETLPRDVTLVQLNVRIPQFLLPVLAERGFTYEIDDSHPGRVLVRIRRGK